MPAGSIEYVLSVNTKTGTANLKKTSNALDSIGSAGKKAGKETSNALDSIGGKAISLNQSLEIARKALNLLSTPVAKLIDVGAKFETLRIQLDQVMQSAQKGKEYFQWIKDFSSKTPFQIEGLTEAVILLENFGINSKKHLKTFGDTASALQIPIKDLSRIMGQIWVKPRAQAEEMLQLIEKGVPVTRILKQEMGLTEGQIANIGNEGIRGSEIFKALARGMERFYGGSMQKMSHTWNGLISTMKDKVNLFIGRISGPVLEKLKLKLDAILSKIDEWANNGTLENIGEQISTFLSNTVEKISETIGFLWRMKNTLLSVGKVLMTIWAIKKMQSFFNVLSSGFTKLSGFLSGMRNISSEMSKATTGFGKAKVGLGKFTSVMGGAIIVGEALAAGFDAISAAQDKAMSKIKTQAEIEKKAWNDIRLIRDKGNRETIEKLQKMKNAARERGIEMGKIALHLQKYFKKEIDIIKKASKNEIKNIKDIEATRKKAEEARKKRLQKIAKIEKEHKKNIELLASSMGILTEQGYRKQSNEINTLLGIYNQYNSQIFENENSINTWLKKLTKLNKTALPEEKENLKQIISELKKHQNILKEKNVEIIRKEQIFTLEDYVNLLQAFNPILGIAVEITSKLSTNTNKLENSQRKVNSNLKDTGNTLLDFAQKGTQVVGLLNKIGVVSDDTANDLNTLLNGVGSLGDGLTKIAAGDIFSGTIQVISGLIDVVGSLIKIFTGDGVKDAIKRQNSWMNLTKEQTKALHDLAKETGDVHMATSLMMSDFIRDAEITTENFDAWARRTREILSDLDSGKLSIQETQETIGDAFSELLKKAQKLGTEGSKEMLFLIKDVKERGLEITEITEYIISKVQSGISALSDYYKYAVKDQESFNRAQLYTISLFSGLIENGYSFSEAIIYMKDQFEDLRKIVSRSGYEIGEELTKMLDLSDFISNNEILINGINATTQIMKSMFDSAILTTDQMQKAILSFGQDVLHQYEEIIKKGGTETQALQLLAPTLEQILYYSQEHGLQIDENTQKLIKQAQEQGLLNEMTLSDSEKQTMLLEQIVKLLGGDIPYALKNLTTDIENTFKSGEHFVGRFKNSLNGISAFNFDNNFDIKNIPGFADGTNGRWINRPFMFIGSEKGPEFFEFSGKKMRATPMSSINFPSTISSPSIIQPIQNPIQVQLSQQNHFNVTGATVQNDEYDMYRMKRMFEDNDQGITDIIIERVKKEIGYNG